MSDRPHLEVELESGERREFDVEPDSGLLADVLAAHGLPLNTRCGQRGLCRGCEVLLREGTLTLDDQVVVGPATVQACRARIAGKVSVQIPVRSRIEHRPQVGETFHIAVPYAHRPLFPPTKGKRDTGFAVDVGTTTVVVLLVDLVTGEVLSTAGGLNKQVRFGDNVVTRIEAAHTPANLDAMQGAIVSETLQPLLLSACEQAGRSAGRIAGGAIAGNTTMLHLLVGEDPRPLGVAPFTPQFIAGRQVQAEDIGLVSEGLAAGTPIQLLPGIAAYIGADITAGSFATGMVYDRRASLLVDMGTNGEIVLQCDGQLTACATAAGPAFEGCGLSCGTRACQGAISDLQLRLDPFHLKTETIGDVRLGSAVGICGSAYVDFLATARRSGLLGATGRFEPSAWAAVPSQHRFTEDGEQALRLTPSDQPEALRISEVDVALLLQAKAAIGAGIEILLETAKLDATDLGSVYLAGGFGMHLNVAHAIAIGLLPGIREEQVRVMGNTALAGALLTLVDRTTLEELENLRSQVRVVELNLADGFEDRYIDHLMLP